MFWGLAVYKVNDECSIGSRGDNLEFFDYRRFTATCYHAGSNIRKPHKHIYKNPSKDSYKILFISQETHACAYCTNPY